MLDKDKSFNYICNYFLLKIAPLFLFTTNNLKFNSIEV